MDHTCECPICYETFVSSDDLESGLATGNERLAVQGCGHAFCRNCLVDHCKHSISAREIPIRCPAHGSHQCLHILEEHQVKDLFQLGNHNDLEEKHLAVVTDGSTSDAMHSGGNDQVSGISSHWTIFQRLMQKIQDPTLIHCTRCDDLVSPHPTGIMSQDHPNDILCPHCGHKFCAVHGDAHLEQSCKDYKPARQDMKSIKAIRRFTKPCSHCGVPIHKESGCDHIVCASCKQDMCFRCGSHEYLSGEMVRSCSKCAQSFIDHRYIWRYRMTLCFFLPLHIPICILHVLVMATLAIATCGCFCCLGCGIKEIEPEDNNDGNHDESQTKGESKFIFRPMLGASTVLAMVFLPVIDLANQCGFSCCLDMNAITSTATSFDTENDDDDDSQVDMPRESEP